MSTRIQSQVWCTRIQAHNVSSDSNTMCTRIGAQGCNQTWIQAQCVLRLDQQGIQIKASNCDQNVTRT
jgi:hypothetical protein